MKRFLACFYFVFLSIPFANAQDSLVAIGVESAPPFIKVKEGAAPKGLSTEFWDLVENKAQLQFEYKVYDNLSDLLMAIKNGEVDMSINPITVTDRRMQEMDFSQPFFISGTAVARKYESNWRGVLKNIFSWQFISAVAVLLFVIFIF